VIATDHEPIEGVDETFDVVFDAVAGSFVERVVTRMAPRGRLVLYGILSGEPTPLPLFPTIVGALRITGMHFGYHVLAEPRAREAVVRALRQQAADGVYTPTVDATWPFDDIDKAYAYLERSNQVGKVVVQISP
jgi:NADPH:quinone reductase-like Zn-dependent oxidoreductase